MKLKNFFEAETDDMNKTKPPGKMGDFMNTAQVAVELGVSMAQVRTWVKEKRLKSIPPEKGKRDHSFLMSDVKEFEKIPRERTGRPKGT